MQNMPEDLRIQDQQELINPETLLTTLPLTSSSVKTVNHARSTINQIMQGNDKRLLVIVGPCSIHHTEAAMEYALLLSEAAMRFAEHLFIVMRVYFEKPRTTLGWKGFISDPYLDGSFQINKGLHYARKFLLDLNSLGVPAATEFLDPLLPHYLHDLISWCAVGARTSQSQIHRELASGLSMPVGFKNNTDGNIQVAIDGIQVAAHPHPLLTINKKGIPSIMNTKGNAACHLVLRGSNNSPNFSSEHVQAAIKLLKHANVPQHIVIDCSHGNSMKLHAMQLQVVDSVIMQITQGAKEIRGIMLESNLVEGKQTLVNNQPLQYGQSITDACIGWKETLQCFEKLANLFLSL